MLGRRGLAEERVAVLREDAVDEPRGVERRARRLGLAGREDDGRPQSAEHGDAGGAPRVEGRARVQTPVRRVAAAAPPLPRVARALDDDDEPHAEAEEERRAAVGEEEVRVFVLGLEQGRRRRLHEPERQVHCECLAPQIALGLHLQSLSRNDHVGRAQSCPLAHHAAVVEGPEAVDAHEFHGATGL